MQQINWYTIYLSLSRKDSALVHCFQFLYFHILITLCFFILFLRWCGHFVSLFTKKQLVVMLACVVNPVIITIILFRTALLQLFTGPFNFIICVPLYESYGHSNFFYDRLRFYDCIFRVHAYLNLRKPVFGAPLRRAPSPRPRLCSCRKVNVCRRILNYTLNNFYLIIVELKLSILYYYLFIYL